MKFLDRLILKNFLGPFFLTTTVVVFIFLMRFLMMYFDYFVGKNLGLEVYIELFSYFSLITVPTALPLSSLLAALVSFGNLGEHTELTAMKGAGIPLARILLPTLVFSVFVAMGSFFYNNHVNPWANLKGYSMLYDIKVTKNSLNIRPGLFYREIPGYSIKISEKNQETDVLKNVIIYDHTDRNGNSKVTIADSGKMYMLYQDQYLVFELWNGHNYIEQKNRGNVFNDTPLIINRFAKNKMVFSLESFGMKKTDENEFKYHEYMKDISELNSQIDSTKKDLDKAVKSQVKAVKYMNTFQFKAEQRAQVADTAVKLNSITGGPWVYTKMEQLDTDYRMEEIKAAVNSNVQSLKSQLQTNASIIYSKRKEMRSAAIEKWHKFTFAIACIVMFIIGGALGAIIKRGGFGLPVVVAVSFFILYYVLMQLGDKNAREGIIPLQVGVWFPNAVLGIVATYLLNRATKDLPLFPSFESISFKIFQAKKTDLS